MHLINFEKNLGKVVQYLDVDRLLQIDVYLCTHAQKSILFVGMCIKI